MMRKNRRLFVVFFLFIKKGGIYLAVNRERLIYLYETNLFTRNMLRNMLNIDPSFEYFLTLSSIELVHTLKVSNRKATAIYNVLQNLKKENLPLSTYNGMKVITLFDDSYPEKLKHIPDCPLVLYCIGNISFMHHSDSISVIGSRQPSIEAKQKLQFIVTPLIRKKWVIVSGLAYGIDSAAHRLTLQLKGHTIAVLGGGFNHIYPRENKDLFHFMSIKGLVVSEYPPQVPPQRYHFPERNRIISGLSKATLVIEAKERSGTIITVDQALEQGREVYAVPGSIFHEQTRGCHQLIQEGAKLVMTAKDIIEDFV